MLEHIKVLSSDEFEGRAPGTRAKSSPSSTSRTSSRSSGSSRATPTAPTSRRCRWSASPAANTEPLTVTQGRHEAHVQVARRGGRLDEARRRRRGDRELRDRSSPATASTAPEFNWDDFKDVDVKGKTIVVLVNDPQVPDPADPVEARSEDVQRQGDDLLRPLDLQVRGGRAHAARPAILIVHETGPAGYPFAVVQGNLRREVRPGDARQEHGPRRHRGLAHARRREDAS